MLLTNTEIETYRRDGLVIPSAFRVPDSMLKRIDELYQKLLEDNRDREDFSADFILGPHLDANGTYGVKGDPEWLEFAKIPEILDMVEQLIGPDFILWGMTIFGKPARHGKATPWHQDGDYYPIEPLETLTVWISLDGSTPEQGCMKFIPGSHREHRIYSHHFEHRDDYTLAQVIDDDQVDLEQARDIVLAPGQISLHDVYLVHGSDANRSDRRRMGLVLRIMPATSFYNHHSGKIKEDAGSPHGYSNRALFLLRGEDKSGRNDFARGHD
ncbi:MAG: phytanoyl-CoA dioxygenase family protein [Gammaproteobacteria bacterium]|nr:phytanoyl-CoA dioxygenase family protein [Gammaproteobacteria bacterium]MDH3534938.1 phytanoyl-CoA dioxygenase family protein [Gammaproteobacteria bacterium]